MHAKSLMIGDWVNIKDYPMKFEPKQFTEQHWTRSLCEFEPITLSEEILKANGIEYQYGNPWWQGMYPHDIHIDRKDGKGELFMQISYVHELQHALRLCGLNDMADNFKLATTE